jgi:hypothetical protein
MRGKKRVGFFNLGNYEKMATTKEEMVMKYKDP